MRQNQVSKPCVKCGSSERDNYGDCKPCRRERNAAWITANRDRVREQRAKRYAANATKVSEQMAAYRAANAEKIRAQQAGYHAANLEKFRIREQNRRARKRAVGGKLSADLAERLFKLQRGKCACCKTPLGDKYHRDHYIPLALDGPNEDWNMQLLCIPCNLQKGAKHPVDFMQQRGFLL